MRALEPIAPGGESARRFHGFTLLEVLIASAILSLLFLGIAPFFAARFSASSEASHSWRPWAIMGSGFPSSSTSCNPSPRFVAAACSASRRLRLKPVDACSPKK